MRILYLIDSRSQEEIIESMESVEEDILELLRPNYREIAEVDITRDEIHKHWNPEDPIEEFEKTVKCSECGLICEKNKMTHHMNRKHETADIEQIRKIKPGDIVMEDNNLHYYIGGHNIIDGNWETFENVFQ